MVFRHTGSSDTQQTDGNAGDGTGEDAGTEQDGGSRSKRDRRCPVSRRSFLASTAAAGAAVTGVASGADTAEAQAENRNAMTDEFEYVYDNVGSGERIPTFIDVWDQRVRQTIEDVGESFQWTDDPWPAAYARLTREEAAELSENFLVTRLDFAPGANPFWKHWEYPDGEVFPDTTEAVDYIAYEEAVAALQYFEEAYPDRISTERIGQSPGLVDELAGETVQNDVWLAELTNDVNADSFADKEKVVCSIGIHGDERSGVETGLRTIENVLTGDEPEIEQRLDDIALVFVLSNPDGWISRVPRTVNVEEESTDAFMRLTGSENDPNRQYPTVGSIDPSNYPAEPNGSNLRDDGQGIDDDVPAEYRENVPDALGIVDRLREYDNVAFAADYHGMYGDDYLFKGLLMNDPYGVDRHAVMDEFNEAVKSRAEETAGRLLEENRQAIDDAARARAPRGGAPSQVYTYGTIYDTIGYTASGAIGNWLTNDAEKGGLDAPGLVFEMALDNSNYGVQVDYRPKLVETQVAAYAATIRQMAVQATADLDTGIDDRNRSLGYVDTDALTRRSEDLPFAETEVWTADGTVQTADSGFVRLDKPAHTLSISVRTAGGEVTTATVDGPGVTTTETVGDGEFARGADWLFTDVRPGKWTISVDGEEGMAAVDVTVVEAQASPDPGEVLGFEQREYSVSPTTYFEDYGDAVEGGTVESSTVESIADGALVAGGQPTVDVLAIIHDEGIDNRAYLNALDEYLEAGGDLVLTDSGISLLAELDAGGAGSISSRDIRTVQNRFPVLEDKSSHPLLDGVRPIEQELWTVPTLGYTVDDGAPMTLVDQTAFENAGGELAALASGDVVLGELDSISVIGSLLPPASQDNLHPFGLPDYGISAMGQRVLLNAIGHEQR